MTQPSGSSGPGEARCKWGFVLSVELINVWRDCTGGGRNGGVKEDSFLARVAWEEELSPTIMEGQGGAGLGRSVRDSGLEMSIPRAFHVSLGKLKSDDSGTLPHGGRGGGIRPRSRWPRVACQFPCATSNVRSLRSKRMKTCVGRTQNMLTRRLSPISQRRLPSANSSAHQHQAHGPLWGVPFTQNLNLVRRGLFVPPWPPNENTVKSTTSCSKPQSYKL